MHSGWIVATHKILRMAFMAFLAGIIFWVVDSTKQISTKFDIKGLQYALTRELNRGLYRSHITLVYLQVKLHRSSHQRLIIQQFTPHHKTQIASLSEHFYMAKLNKIQWLIMYRSTLELVMKKLYFFYHGETAPGGPGSPHYRSFTIILRHTTLGRTPLDEWSARRRDLCLTTHNIHKRQISMPPTGFESTIPASERSQTHVLDRADTGIGEEGLYM